MAEELPLFNHSKPSAGTVLNADQRFCGDLAFAILCSFFVILFSAAVYFFEGVI